MLGVVGQQLANRVASVCTPCWPCCMLLRVVRSCCAKFETGQTFSFVQTDPTTCWEYLANNWPTLANKVASVYTPCWPCCMLLRVVRSCCAKFETGQTFSFVQTDPTTCWEYLANNWPTLANKVASVYTPCWPCCMLLRVVRSCCAKFETGQTFSFVQTDATKCWE